MNELGSTANEEDQPRWAKTYISDMKWTKRGWIIQLQGWNTQPLAEYLHEVLEEEDDIPVADVRWEE